MSEGVAPFYTGWRLLNDRLVETTSSLTTDELAWAPAPHMWPIWALVGHVAAARVYWLCHVLKEPGVETTPFTDPSGEGWEDDLSRPRAADELVRALRSTFAIVQACLERWTPEMLATEFPRARDGAIQLHTRQSIVWRLISHDASHTGEVSQILGSHGRGEIEIWSGLSRVVPAT